LARHAGAGPALELGIGTGRIARPLAARGIEVHGIEISRVMIEQLKATLGGLPIRAMHGSIVDFEPPRRYPLVYCSMNTFFFLTTREVQERAFATIARALNDDGVFIVDNSVLPHPDHARAGQKSEIIELTADSVTLQFSLHNAAEQTLEYQRVVLGASGVVLHPWVLRYALPDELDEMAAQSGLRLRTRWADWDGEPFTQKSRRHISVYGRQGEQGLR
jgi:SAM-dependent methyltransferase